MLNKSLKLFFAAMLFVLTTQGGSFAQDAKFRVPLNGSPTTQCILNSTCASKVGSTNRSHTGLDYTAANKDILASNAGKIVKIKNNGDLDHGLGNTVIIEHKIINTQGGIETLYSQYSHLESFMPGLYETQSVAKGQKIGTMGGTGHGKVEWGIHLHFEIKRVAVIHNPYGDKACTHEGGVKDVCWGYTPSDAATYGYIDPAWFINSNTTAIGNDYAYWEFTGASNYEGWSLMNWAAWSVNGGTLFIDPSGDDPNIQSPELFVDASVLKHLKFSMASNAPDGNMQIFFKTVAENYYHESRKIDYPAQNNGQFKDYSINLSSHQKWAGKITGVRIDPATAGKSGTNTDTIGWHWIRLSQNP